MKPGEESVRESAFKVLLDLHVGLNNKTAEAMSIVSGIRNDLLGDRAEPTTNVPEKHPDGFGGAVGGLINSSRSTMKHVSEIVSLLVELRAEIPRQEINKIDVRR